MLTALKEKVKQNKALFDAYVGLINECKLWAVAGFNVKKGRLFHIVKPHTMVPFRGLSNVYDLAKRVEREKIAGAIVECGVWKGGCSAVMAEAVREAEPPREIWLFDSFEGVPEPTEVDGAEAKRLAAGRATGKLAPIAQYVGPLDTVKRIFFSTLKIAEAHVHIRQGWFQDTLAGAKKEVGPIALLRLDGDWYESTKVCLDNLYDNVVSGGYVVIDDYGHWEGCKKAVDEFFAARKIQVDLVPVTYSIRYFKKP